MKHPKGLVLYLLERLRSVLWLLRCVGRTRSLLLPENYVIILGNHTHTWFFDFLLSFFLSFTHSEKRNFPSSFSGVVSPQVTQTISSRSGQFEREILLIELIHCFAH